MPSTLRLLLAFLAALTTPLTTTAISLLNGRFDTTTDVQDLLNLALDAAAMREATDFATKQSIYEEGVQSSGGGGANTITLQSLSLNAKDQMSQSPMFNIFRHAFLVLGKANEGETEGSFDGHPVEQYGDTLVNDLFSLSIEDEETEAALVTSVWMAAVDALFQVLQECKASNKVQGLAALDRAAALWIGEGQVEGSNDEGHLLYDLAENAGERFGQQDGEAEVNTQLLDRFLAVQTSLMGNTCDTLQGYIDMRPIIRRMVGLMTVPLVQNMIHYSKTLQSTGTGSSFVELYALAVIPRVAACGPSAYDEALHLEILRDLKPTEVGTAIAGIQKAYGCLDISCADVGSYLGGAVPACDDDPAVTAAGYTTTRAGAREKSQLELDIKAIDIFLRFEAYGAADDWYTYGWNAEGYSLKDLALNQVVPTVTDNSYITAFQNYYAGDNFADSLISNTIDLVPPFNSADKEQVRAMVNGILRNVVMFMTSATSLQYAVEQCGSDKTTALDFWDTGALFYIGSMEGENVNGNAFGGELLYTSAKELCTEFGTCSSEAVDNGNVAIAAVNDKMLTGLNAGVISINGGSCDEAERILNEDILPTMIIPMIQGTIKYASYNAGLQIGTSDSSLAIGDTFARGILPIVDQSNPDSATTLTSNMEFQLSTQPVPGGFSAVADAMRTALTGMSTACADVGQFEDEPSDGNMCGAGPVTSPTPPSTGGWSGGPLAFGRYTFQDMDAVADAAFALDVRDMYNAPSADAATTIYLEGKNKIGKPLFGNPSVQSLSALSLNMSEAMMEDPMYSIYRYALYDDSDLDDTTEGNFTFGDDVVSASLSGGQDQQLAAQATVVMNVWMVIVHRLYEAQWACDDEADPVPFIDSAVALWIGEEQQEGKFDQGWMVYSIAQTAAKNLGLKEGEAKVNTELMKLFNEAQTAAASCNTDDGQFAFYFLIHEIVRLLSKVLIVAFMSHLFIDGHNMVELYSVSVFPQAYACEQAVGDTLENLFVLNYSKTAIDDDVKEQLAAFLRCQRITFEDLTYGTSVGDEVSNFLLSIDNRLNYYVEASDHLPMAGYEPNSDVSEVARMDLDATMIKIMIHTNAKDAAKDIYRYGRNAYSKVTSEFMTFQDLLISEGTKAAPMFKIYSDYYSSETYATDLLMDAISASGQYAGVSRYQRAEVVYRSLQTMVSFIATFGKMQDAVTSCQSDDLLQAQSDWDSAVALYIGSSEGLLAGGRQEGAGAFMYALSEDVCDEFGQCQSSGETKENEGLLLEFASGRDAAKDGKCDYLSRIIQDEITSKMAAALVQGFLAFAVKSQDASSEGIEQLLVGKHVAAKAIIPLVSKVNTASAAALDSIYGKLGNSWQSSSTNSMSDVVGYVASALRGMGINCADIGTPVNYPEYSLCLGDGGTGLGGNVPGQAPDADTPTDLGDGLYVTTTYVQDRANIAKDISDMEESLSSNSVNLAKLVYEEGKNSEIYDENGKFVILRSLKSFSTDETNEMLDEPLFNIFMYGLQGSNGQFMSRDVRLYADSIVEDAFNSVSTDPKLPVEAALVTNLWMYIAHLLYKTLKDCKNKEIKDEDGIHSIDIAVAYWIGDGQVAGSADNGHLLYALAERMGELFNMDTGGQSRTNTNILKLFNEAKHELSLPGSCSDSPSSYLHLSRLANNIVSLMAVPLIQGLIHNLRLDNRPRVKLYAHAVVPLAAGCGPGNYEYLKGKLLNMSYNAGEIEEIVAAIRGIYPCLGLTCDDIGVHESEMTDDTARCKDPDPFTSFAGYKPASDVGEFARLDLDIRQLEILLDMKAYAAAENLYTYGKHVKGVDVGTMSLFHLASTSERKLVPEYDAFIRYYGNTYDDPSIYADHIIRAALNGSGQLQWTDAQRKVIVLKSAQVLVMYFGALQALYEAVSDCQSSASSESVGYSDQWDRGAALLIGSLEGTQTNGTQEGYMYYDLAQDYCTEFNTCAESNSGVTINEQLISLLYTGRGAALGNSCNGLRRAADEISTLMLIPVIQGALYSATELSKAYLIETDADLRRAEGFVYSRAILPLVANANWGASQDIDEYLGFPAPSSSGQTASKVFSAFAEVYPKMDVDCELIGTVQGNDPCSGVVYDQSNRNLVWIIVGSVLGVCLLCAGGLFWQRRKRSAKLPENNPSFVAHETGELNHSMDLLEKAFSSNTGIRTSTANSTETVPLAEDMVHDASPPITDDDDDDDDFDEVTALHSKLAESDII